MGPVDHIPRLGGRFTPRLGRLWLALFGWRIEGEMPNRSKLVMSVAPHTSNWDFPLGVALMWALDVRLNFMGKRSLFIWPFSIWLRSIGGIPVDRSKPNGVVGEMVEAFARADSLLLAIAPQGTRSPVTQFKSGFWHIARGANLPIQTVYFDYGRRILGFGPLFELSDDCDADIAKIEAFYAPIKGRNPNPAQG